MNEDIYIYDTELTKKYTYFSLKGGAWGFYCEYFGENGSCHIFTTVCKWNSMCLQISS